MSKTYTVYCIFLVSLLAYGNYQGYVFTNLFAGQSSAAQSANHYHK